ncbi:hypothetical protein GCM10010222_26300 [Streptomyces tanashiensis]|nr:hypothetical protein GCM10010222_26300 [Streptomyces tanashiensis]
MVATVTVGGGVAWARATAAGVVEVDDGDAGVAGVVADRPGAAPRGGPLRGGEDGRVGGGGTEAAEEKGAVRATRRFARAEDFERLAATEGPAAVERRSAAAAQRAIAEAPRGMRVPAEPEVTRARRRRMTPRWINFARRSIKSLTVSPC